MTTGERVRAERLKRGMTQIDVSNASEVSLAMLSNVERGIEPGPIVKAKLEKWMKS